MEDINTLLRITYLGLALFGSQKQKNQPLTAQSLVEKALSQLYGCRIDVHPVSRLDRMVSAKAYDVSYKSVRRYAPKKIIYVLNRFLPKYMRVVSAHEVPLSFVPRYEAEFKTYLYTVGLNSPDPLDSPLVFYPPFAFDKERLKEAMRLFKGEHDFSSFCSDAKEGEENPFKKVEDVFFEEDGDHLRIFVKGHAFGRYQVRFMVGAAVSVSEGKMKMDDILTRLEGKTQKGIGTKAPGEALVLYDVTYRKEGTEDA